MAEIRNSDRRFRSIERRLDRLEGAEMATQAQVDADTAALVQVATDLATATADLQAEINALATANPALDLTALNAAVSPLDVAVVALQSLKPTPPVVATVYFDVVPTPTDATVWVASGFNDGDTPPDELYVLAAGAVNDGTGIEFTGTPVADAPAA